jgi:hypothetical protein
MTDETANTARQISQAKKNAAALPPTTLSHVRRAQAVVADRSIG